MKRANLWNCLFWQNGEGNYNGTGIDLIEADPLFFNLADGDFRLLPGSPAINAGTSTFAPSFDIWGRPRPIGAGYDIGAHEFDPPGYVAPTPTPTPTPTATPTPTPIGQPPFGLHPRHCFSPPARARVRTYST